MGAISARAGVVSLGSLLQSLAQNSTIVDSRNKADHVDKAGHSMDASESLVQGHHLLRMGSRVVAPFAIASFC